jgi:hypothetical protein
MPNNRSLLIKLKLNLPWLMRYPFARASSFLERKAFERKHVIFTVANHFVPSWRQRGLLNLDEQRQRLDEYFKTARKTGEAVIDADGTKFRHTNFFPAEQYHKELLNTLAAMQAEGLGETEIHLHHGVEKPDTAENLRRTLVNFRDRLAEEHRSLSRMDGAGDPMYAFVHGNHALGNSASGKFCGVNGELQILSETGCYADMTLPSAPAESQMPVINQIYECALSLNEKMPHRRGKRVEVRGNSESEPQLPLIVTGPLVFNWTRRIKGFPVPRIEDGALAGNRSTSLARFRRWMSANVTVKGRPEWVFVKLYCHGFFDYDQSACIGEDARRFFSEIIENGEKSSEYKVHFASAREAFNIILAARDGAAGDPNDYRNYRLQAIMNETAA